LKYRLPAWQRRALFASAWGLLLSGIAWLALHYVLAGGDGLPSPLEPWAMRVHGMAAIVAIFALGALSESHVPHGWRLSARHRWAGQRGTGIALCGLGAMLVATGYLLYYFAPDSIRPAVGWVHSLVGLAAAGILVQHWRARR
jgi:hypothetical protein